MKKKTRFRELLESVAKEGPIGFRASKLLEAADREAITLEGAATREDLLDEFDLDPSDITPIVITRARLLDRTWWEGFRNGPSSRPNKKPSQGPPKPRQREERSAKPLPLDDTPTVPRTKLLGFSAMSVLRWMGKEDWTLEEAQTAVEALGCDLSPVTIKIQLKAGRSGKGEPAKLSLAQENKLYNSLKK